MKTQNACDGCSMCCKLLGVEELKKPVNKWCDHCTHTSCGIYESRPQSCQDYKCVWLALNLKPSLKPNRCKIIFDINKDGSMLVARVDPNYPGAIRNEDVTNFLDSLDNNLIVYVIIGDKRYIYGHADNEEILNIVENAIQVMPT